MTIMKEADSELKALLQNHKERVESFGKMGKQLQSNWKCCTNGILLLMKSNDS